MNNTYNILPSIACGCIPTISGEYTFYQELSAGLDIYNWHTHCVTLGCNESRLWDKEIAVPSCQAIAPQVLDTSLIGELFAYWCELNNCRVVMTINSKALAESLVFLPKEIKVLARCVYTTKDNYENIVKILPRITKIIVPTPRQLWDLTRIYGVSPDVIRLIPNGINTNTFSLGKINQLENRAIRLLYLGRLNQEYKGILHIPNIINEIEEAGIPYHLTVVGSGPDEKLLISLMHEFIKKRKVSFLGWINRKYIPHILRDQDILLFPSQIEGFGFSLVEAMACGCIPVASRIFGVTDFIIRDGETGFLCSMDKYGDFADKVVNLFNNPSKYLRMKRLAFEWVNCQFNCRDMGSNYAELFTEIA